MFAVAFGILLAYGIGLVLAILLAIAVHRFFSAPAGQKQTVRRPYRRRGR